MSTWSKSCSTRRPLNSSLCAEKETWVDAVIAVSQSALVFTDSRQRFGASSSSTLVGQHENGSQLDHGHEPSDTTQHAGEAARREGDDSGGGLDAGEGGGDRGCLARHLQWEIKCLQASFQVRQYAYVHV